MNLTLKNLFAVLDQFALFHTFSTFFEHMAHFLKYLLTLSLFIFQNESSMSWNRSKKALFICFDFPQQFILCFFHFGASHSSFRQSSANFCTKVNKKRILQKNKLQRKMDEKFILDRTKVVPTYRLQKYWRTFLKYKKHYSRLFAQLLSRLKSKIKIWI